MKTRALIALPLCLGCSVAGAGAGWAAQAPPGETPPPAPVSSPPAPLAVEDLPPQIRVGLRVAMVSARIPARSAAVIVPDAAAYIEAIAAWTTEARFPVLLDDGSDIARENIARFVRAFQPAHVLWWAGSGQPDKDALKARVDSAAAAAWGAPGAEALAEQWKRIGFEPAGACIAAELDPAWTAALALAAGRGQPIVWLERAGPEPLGGSFTDVDLASFSSALDSGLDATGHAWRAMGDVIESVALCLSLPTKCVINGQILALTDCLGRIEGAPIRDNTVARAYAVGIVPGDEATAAYRAMCALFLQPKKAWLFEGYAPDASDPKTAGFAQYALGPGVDILTRAGFQATAEDAPRDALGDWRRRVSAGIDADVIHVNSSGAREWFMLKSGRAEGSDVPVALERPAVVHFIHSFSAQDLSDANSIAARWLDAGAYAYVGSVDEPFLTAFHSPERVFARLLAPAPLAFAARVDAPQPWKINIFGDPLLTVLPPAMPAGPAARAERLPDPPALEAAETMSDRMKSALTERRLGDAARAMAILGRDADVLKVFTSAAADPAAPASPGLASAAFWAAGRAGFGDALFSAYARLDTREQESQRVIDALWQWGRTALEASPTPAMISALKPRLRAPTLADDAVALAKAVRRVEGAEAARAFCNEVVSGVTDLSAREKLQERLRIF